MIFGFGKIPQIFVSICANIDLKNNLRVLDLGCGPGTASISFLHFLNLYSDSEAMFKDSNIERTVSLVQVDGSQDMLAMARELTEGSFNSSKRVKASIEEQCLLNLTASETEEEKKILSAGYDVILVQDLFGELKFSVSGRANLLGRIYNSLNEGGICVVVDRSRSRLVQEFHQVISKTAEDGATLLAPCAAIFDNPSGVKCYSCSASQHQSLLRCQFVEKISKASHLYDFRQLDEENNWSYAVFQKNGQLIQEVIPKDENLIPIERFVRELNPSSTDRFDIAASVIKCDDKNLQIFSLCDQSCGAEFALLHFKSPGYHSLIEYGDVLIIKNVAVVKEEIADEGIVKIHFYVDNESVVENLSATSRKVTFSEAMLEMGKNA